MKISFKKNIFLPLLSVTILLLLILLNYNIILTGWPSGVDVTNLANAQAVKDVGRCYDFPRWFPPFGATPCQAHPLPDILVAIFSTITTLSITWSYVLVVNMSIIASCILVYNLSKIIFNSRLSGYYACILFIGSSILGQWYSIMVYPNIISYVFCLTAVYALMRFSSTKKVLTIILVGASIACAFLTMAFTVFYLVLPMFILGILIISHYFKDQSHRLVWRNQVIILLLSMLFAVFLMTPWLIHNFSFVISVPSGSGTISDSINNQVFNNTSSIVDFLYVLDIILCLLLIVKSFCYFSNIQFNSIPTLLRMDFHKFFFYLIILVITAVFILQYFGIYFFNERLLGSALPFLAIGMGFILYSIQRLITGKYLFVPVIILFIVVSFVFSVTKESRPWFSRADDEVVQWLKANTTDQDIIGYFGSHASLWWYAQLSKRQFIEFFYPVSDAGQLIRHDSAIFTETNKHIKYIVCRDTCLLPQESIRLFSNIYTVYAVNAFVSDIVKPHYDQDSSKAIYLMLLDQTWSSRYYYDKDGRAFRMPQGSSAGRFELNTELLASKNILHDGYTVKPLVVRIEILDREKSKMALWNSSGEIISNVIDTNGDNSRHRLEFYIDDGRELTQSLYFLSTSWPRHVAHYLYDITIPK